MNYADNKVELTGFAGNSAEIKELSNGKKLSKVSIAVNENYRGAGGAEVRNTQWFNLTFWNAKADEAALLIKKGTRLSIEGRLSAQQYEAKDGTKRYTTEIIVNELKVLNQSTDQQEQES